MNKIILILTVFSIPLSIVIFGGSSRNAEAVTNTEAPIVLELFTSQSCSSCPPADRLLGELAQENDNIIALSCNVTYWNHLHWKDTLSREFCTNRQRQYVRSLQSRGPYTPQVIINGRDEMVGSSEGKVRRSISKQALIKNINLNLTGETLEIQLPETPGNDSYALHLILVGKTHAQDIPSGENKGRRVSYTNPIENIISLGTWDGTGKIMSHNVSNYKDTKNFVILAQTNGVTGPIKAAGQIKSR